jgi:hypothetical protein
MMELPDLARAQVVKEVVNPEAKIVYKENTADDPTRRKPDISKARTARLVWLAACSGAVMHVHSPWHWLLKRADMQCTAVAAAL